MLPHQKEKWTDFSDFADLMLHHFQIFLWKLFMSTLSYSKHLKIAASDDNNSSSFLEGPLQRSLETLFFTHCLHSLLLTDNHLFFLQVWATDSWTAEQLKVTEKEKDQFSPKKGCKVHEQKNTLRDTEESLVSKKFLLHFTWPCLPGLVPGLSSPPFNAHLLIKYHPTMLQWETSKAVKVLSLYCYTPEYTQDYNCQNTKMKDEWDEPRWDCLGL